MRIKSIIATHMDQAMRRLREELGDEAVIVDTQEAEGGGVFVTATVGPVDRNTPAYDSIATHDGADGSIETVRQALHRHNTPPPLIDRLTGTADTLAAGDPMMALAGALDAHFRFQPLLDPVDTRPLIFVGTPGVGKTVTVARLAAEAVLRRKTVAVISADTGRAGGVEQLSTFMSVLDLPIHRAGNATELDEAVENCRDTELVLIDAPGCNPFDAEDMAPAASLIRTTGAEPVLVLSAGGDPADSADITRAFADLGTRRMVVTRLDLSRRLGGMLVAADASGIGFSHVSIAREIAHSLHPVNPVSLARLLMTVHEDVDQRPPTHEATPANPGASAA